MAHRHIPDRKHGSTSNVYCFRVVFFISRSSFADLLCIPHAKSPQQLQATVTTPEHAQQKLDFNPYPAKVIY